MEAERKCHVRRLDIPQQWRASRHRGSTQGRLPGRRLDRKCVSKPGVGQMRGPPAGHQPVFK
eukprot:7988491-Alexandrium_andersonii.AAC.1